MRRGRTVTVMAGMALAAFLAAAPLAAAATTTSPPVNDPFVSGPPVSTPPTTSSPSSTVPVNDPFEPVPLGANVTVHVSIVDFGFSPATVTVAAGTTVTWTNTGAAIHSVTSNSGAFDSSPTCPAGPCIDPGSSYSHRFGQAGTFAYHCKVHANMTGTVVVNGAPTTTTTAASSTTAPGNGNPPVSAGGTPPSTAGPQANGDELAFTGASRTEGLLALGALGAIALGLALRPRRRPFPEPPNPN